MKLIFSISHIYLGIKRKLSHKINDWASKKDIQYGKGVRFTNTAKVENLSQNASDIVIGDNTIIEGKLLIFKFGGKIQIGKNSYVGLNSNIRSGERISIGHNVLISHNVNIIDTNSHEIDYKERALNYNKFLSKGMAKEKGNVFTGAIIIEDHVWISFGVAILKNVKIGKGAIIAANSVVTKDVASFTLVGGNPAKVIKKLN